MSRRGLNLYDLSDAEHLALRQILLTEGISMSQFFSRYAKEYIAANKNKIPYLAVVPKKTKATR